MQINTEQTASLLERGIRDATGVEVDTIWAILKYKEIGIFRKVGCICDLLGLDFNRPIEEMPQDENRRVLDQKTRHLIHDA